MATRAGRVSVVIPAYNYARFLPAALESVFAQTAPVGEVIVVDDGSTDGTRQALAPFLDRIVLLQQPNRGEAVARNAGMERASGDWVAFLDADDAWEPRKIERQVGRLGRGSCVHSSYYLFGDEACVPATPARFLVERYAPEFLLLGEDWICPSSAIVRRDTRVRFREWAKMSADIVFFAELCAEGRFELVDEPLTGYRRHARSTNQLPGALALGLDSQLRWVRELAPPDRRQGLERILFGKVLEAMSSAKWTRRWDRYWEWREWLARNWPAGDPRPADLDEPIYPAFLYSIKDAIESRLKLGEERRVG